MEYNTPVRIGDATVLPGDIVIGGDGGVLFFPPEILADVLEAAEEHEAQEDFQRELLLQKRYRFRDVYPLSPPLREEFEEDPGPLGARLPRGTMALSDGTKSVQVASGG